MNEKKYLNWYNKIGYGSGDIAGNVIYAFLSSFVMIFLTDTVGLNAGIVGTLMMFSKLFDGVSDIFFGSMIDKTKTKMGKARPGMLWAYLGNAIMLAAIFMVPANNIAYSSLTALITKNGGERVQMGSIRFIFAFGTSLAIQSVTVEAVKMLGGGAAGWRTVAIIYAVIGLVVNTISVFSVKELPEEELGGAGSAEAEEKYSLVDAGKMLLANKFYLIICCVYILTQIFTATLNMGIYYMTYILGDESLLGVFAFAINLPLICGLVFTPMLVKRFKGMYKVNLWGYILATASRAMVIVAGYMGNVPLMLLFSATASIGMSPLQGDMNALIASCSEYTFRTKHRRIDGTMYSCSSLGVKIGSGVGTALAGWLLAAGGYVANAAVQPQSCINMLYLMYLWIPMIINLLITVLLSRLKVEQANAALEEAVPISER